MDDLSNLYKIKKKTICRVIIFHVIFILFLSLQRKSLNHKKKQKILINTVIEKPIAAPATEQTPIQEKFIIVKEEKTFKETPRLKIPITEKKTAIKYIDKPKEASRKKAADNTKKAQQKKIIPKSDNFENLINKLEKQINQIDNPKIATADQNLSGALKVKASEETGLLVPKSIKTLNIDNKIPDIETAPLWEIKELIIRELRDNLNLPEYGEVKVSFTIFPDGEIKDVAVLRYKSDLNQKYLKNSLSELSFKSIKRMFNEPQKFIVIFKNE